MLKVAVATVVAALAVCAGASGATRVWYSEDGFSVEYKPREFTSIALGAHGSLTPLHWRSWGGSTATATASYRNSGSWPVRVRLSKRTHCGTARVYLRRTFTLRTSAPSWVRRYVADLSAITTNCPPQESGPGPNG